MLAWNEREDWGMVTTKLRNLCETKKERGEGERERKGEEEEAELARGEGVPTDDRVQR